MLIIWLLQQWDEFRNTVYLLCVLIACRECVSYTSILCTKRYSFFDIKIFRKCGSVQIVFLYCWIHVKKTFLVTSLWELKQKKWSKDWKNNRSEGKKYFILKFSFLCFYPILLNWHDLQRRFDAIIPLL